jgi:PTH1 family peptidyl-tRNA hydrolase
MSILLVAGLGNPGRDYANTRHNAGFALVEALASRHGVSWKVQARFEAKIGRWDRAGGRTCVLVEPQTYMNDSGRAVRAIADFYKVPPDEVIAVYDDLTIELGRIKLTVRGSAGGHNGVSSLIEHLGGGFVRYRLGIGPKHPPEMDLKDFVLGKFTPEEQTTFNQHLNAYIDGLELLLDQGTDQAMNKLNRRTDQNDADQTQIPRDLHPR